MCLEDNVAWCYSCSAHKDARTFSTVGVGLISLLCHECEVRNTNSKLKETK